MADDERANCGSRVDAGLIGSLFDSHARALVLYARQLCDEPQDAVQQAFLKLARQRRPPDHPVAWLYAVVRNEAGQAVRAASRRRRRQQTAAQRDPRWFADPVSDAESREIAAAIEGLSRQQREIVTARLWGDLTFREIGKLTGMSDSAAQRQYQAALGTLRKKFNGGKTDE